MSLRSIHILFIVLSVALAFLFGTWAVRSYSVAAGIASFVVGAGLVVYGVWFLRKTKEMGRE